MNDLFSRLGGDGVALENGVRSVPRAQLLADAQRLAAALTRLQLTSVALYADNGIDWIVADLACLHAGIRVTPLPLFFSPGQIAHAVLTCGADALLTDQPLTDLPFVSASAREDLPADGLALYRLDACGPDAVALPEGTHKITFTSGTTGTPKGVCLSATQQLGVADVLARAVATTTTRHLCVLPLSTLLENLAGVYAPLLAGGTVIAPGLAELGLTGSSELDIHRLIGSIARHRPGSLILVPQMLSALTAAAEHGWVPPTSLEFIAVGGGKVSPDLLHRARAAGLPAYEGYGLSECASVVSLNVPGADRPGTVGRPLPHVGVRIDDGEIVVTGNAFLGYAGLPESWGGAQVHTGDLGRLDEDGFIVIEGRRKNLLVTSYGRNLSPEWVEAELLCGPFLRQAVVFGDAQPYCVALLLPRDEATTDEAIATWIDRINGRLPDYARVRDWARLPRPLSSHDRTATDNGRPRRRNIECLYRAVIDGLYQHHQEALGQ